MIVVADTSPVATLKLFHSEVSMEIVNHVQQVLQEAYEQLTIGSAEIYSISKERSLPRYSMLWRILA